MYVEDVRDVLNVEDDGGDGVDVLVADHLIEQRRPSDQRASR